jgi:hypothetical protein
VSRAGIAAQIGLGVRVGDRSTPGMNVTPFLRKIWGVSNDVCAL